MTEEENTCDLCKGSGKFHGHECTYCNGTGEWNFVAQSYVNEHICQCIFLDRKFCPICNKKCHHSSSQNDKQIIDPGYGGIGFKHGTTVNEENKVEEIVA